MQTALASLNLSKHGSSGICTLGQVNAEVQGMIGKLPTRSKVLGSVLPFSLPRLYPICESVSRPVRLIDEKILWKNRWKLHLHLLLFPWSSTDLVGSVHRLESLRLNISTSRHPLECVCQELRFLLLLLLLNCHDCLHSSEFWQGQQQTSWHVEKKDTAVWSCLYSGNLFMTSAKTNFVIGWRWCHPMTSWQESFLVG